MLILSTDLEQVEEVCGSGMNGDQILVWFGRWIRQICDLEVLRTLMGMLKLKPRSCVRGHDT
jgi:hypothetical protein